MSARRFCHECNDTGWVPYHSETLDGELEEAYRLCPNYCTPRRYRGSNTGHPCPRPGTMYYRLGYYRKEHIEIIYAVVGVDHAQEEATYHLKCWLRIARDKANKFLEVQLSEALGKA